MKLFLLPDLQNMTSSKILTKLHYMKTDYKKQKYAEDQPYEYFLIVTIQGLIK